MRERICKNCKWWGKYRVGDCDREGSSFPEDTKTSFEVWITANDDSGLQGGLSTGPNFGCVHFKDKKK